jgi:hypothetical protein
MLYNRFDRKYAVRSEGNNSRWLGKLKLYKCEKELLGSSFDNITGNANEAIHRFLQVHQANRSFPEAQSELQNIPGSGFLTSVALDGNPEPDLVHATGCKQPTLRLQNVCH